MLHVRLDEFYFTVHFCLFTTFFWLLKLSSSPYWWLSDHNMDGGHSNIGLMLLCFRCQIWQSRLVNAAFMTSQNTTILYGFSILPEDTSTRWLWGFRVKPQILWSEGNPRWYFGPLIRSLVLSLLLQFCPRNKLYMTVTRYPFPLMKSHSSFSLIKNAPIVAL